MRHRDGIRRRHAILAGAGLLAGLPPAAMSEEVMQPPDSYPARPVRYVVPYAPGGPTDTVGRVIAEQLSSFWGQRVLVENRPGANGTIGTDLVAKSPPDGYTLLQGTSSTHGSNPAVFARLPYDAQSDFAPAVGLIEGPVYLAVNAQSQFHSVAGLVMHARQMPGRLNFGTSGPGSPQHLAGELLAHRARVQITSIHYNGAAAALLALQRGEIDFYFDSTAPVHEKAGRVRILGVSTQRRWPLAPDVPTMSEAGIPDFEVKGWFGLFLPAGTPGPVVERVNQDANQALAMKDVKQRFEAMGYRCLGGSRPDFAEMVRREAALWAEFVKVNRIQVS